MSVNQLYKQIPLENRLCEGCGNPIQRNITIFNGKLFHYGCFKQSKAKPTHLCLDCFSYLTGKGISKVDFDGIRQKACGNCGSTNLRFLKRWRSAS